MDEYGLRRACAWIGNSPLVAMKNYALLMSTDYLDVTEKTEIKRGANSGAAVAIPEEIAESQSKENTGKPLFPSVVVGDEGLESSAKHGRKRHQRIT